jgi:AcrR family transcriptional regulator
MMAAWVERVKSAFVRQSGVMSEEADPPSPGGRKAEASAETCAALLEAGAALLRDEPVGSVLNQLTARSVATRAGRTTGAFFHHWRSQEAYQRDLVAYVLDPARIEVVAEAQEGILAGLRSGGDALQVLEDSARVNFQSMRADPYIPLWHALWAKHGSDAGVHELLRRHMASVTGSVAALLDAVVTASGRRFRPPFTLDSLAVAVTAVAQGLELRVAIEPERVPMAPHGGPAAHPDDDAWDLYATTVRTLVEAFTEPVPG